MIKLDTEFNRIFDLYNEDIFRLIYSYTLNKQEAKDLLQETFLKLYKNIYKIPKEDIEIKKWLIKVATNSCKDYFKSFQKSKVITTDYSQINSSYKENINNEFEDILNKLERNYRIPLYLYYYEGYKIEEIATILKVKISTIKMRLVRGKEKLKKEMEKEYEKI